jgi:hypothetical protein
MKLIQAGATNLIKMQNPTIYKYKKHTNRGCKKMNISLLGIHYLLLNYGTLVTIGRLSRVSSVIGA